jgi:hypothetical protein
MADVLPMVFAIAVGLGLSLMLLALWNSLRGLLVHGPSAQPGSAARGSVRGALLREKDELLAAIRELRFEHDLGKVSEADFQRLDQRYRGRAREVLRLLDEQLAPHRPRARALLEQALGGAAAPPAAAPEEPTAKESGNTCAKCATRNDADAAFCKKCGTALAAESRP